ncbi:UvrD-helicase domain-containing protein, partial [Ilumatobacter sp.]
MSLTDEQTTVASAEPTVRQLVTAGPGTGKTHTLVARIGHLVDFHDVSPGGVLALSFSRAAVGELTRRLRATGDDAGRVAPITFDSFATRVLAQIDPEGEWKESSFDGRIEEAISRIDDFGEFLERIEHVCVDELQ